MSVDRPHVLLARADRALRSARLLRQDGDPDAAISRCYYAMLYAAQAALLSRGFTYTSHRGVLSGFALNLVRPGLIDRAQHRWLTEAFERRLISDYEVLHASDSLAADAEVKAEQFIAAVRALNTDQ